MGFPVPVPVWRRVFGNRNWEVFEMLRARSRFGDRDIRICLDAVAAWVRRLALTVQRVARQYPSAYLTMVPLAIMAARRS
jgi:hypothetical protein